MLAFRGGVWFFTPFFINKFPTNTVHKYLFYFFSKTGIYTKVNRIFTGMEPKLLKAIITDRGIKQTFIARKLGVSKGLVNQWIKETALISEKHQIELRSLLLN